MPPAPGTKKVAPGIIPKEERKPLPPEYKNRPAKTDEKDKPGSRPLEQYDDDDEREIQTFVGGEEQDFRPLSAQFESEEEKEGSSQSETVEEVKVKRNKKKSSSRKSKKTTTTTTPAPTSSSEEHSSEETQEPQAATNSNARPLVVNRDRGDVRFQLIFVLHTYS